MYKTAEPTEKAIQTALIQQLLVALIWGGTWIAGKIVMQEIPALIAAGWRFLMATIILGLLVWRVEKRFPTLAANDFIAVIAMGAIGIYGYSLCFFYGLKYIQAGRAALVVALNPVCVALGASLLLNEPLTPKKSIGMIIALAGCFIVLGHGRPMAIFQGKIGFGEILIIACVIAWTAYTLMGRRLRNISPLVLTFYASATGCLLLFITVLMQGSLQLWPHFSTKIWVSLVYLGLLGSGLSYVWYANGLRILGATRTAAFVNFVPISAVALSALLLGERIDSMTLLGGALVLTGVTLTNRA